MSNTPDDLMKNPEQLKQMISLLSTMLEQAESTETEEFQQKQQKRVTPKRRGRKPKGTSVNKFDQMSEASMYRDDPDIAKKLYSKPPMQRRPKKSLVDVRCRMCGKQESVSASLIHGGLDRYKCNKCSSSAG
jgi:hypothetical protein